MIDLTKFKKVTKEEFYKVIGPLNVNPHIIGKYPYLISWETPGRQVMGASQDRVPTSEEYKAMGNGENYNTTDYYLPKN